MIDEYQLVGGEWHRRSAASGDAVSQPTCHSSASLRIGTNLTIEGKINQCEDPLFVNVGTSTNTRSWLFSRPIGSYLLTTPIYLLAV